MNAIDSQVVLARLNGIEAEVAELRELAQLPFDTYVQKPNFQLAEYHLHRALEGVFNIAAHLNVRKAGGAGAAGYKDIARTYGELGFVDAEFAHEALTHMAGYRNRLVHFYADITPKETYTLITEHLDDFSTFMRSVRDVLKDPDAFGVGVE